jgi:hypothetical protein
MKISPIIIVVILFLTGCSKGAGDLSGTWKMEGFMPMTVKYTDEHEEAMGIISEVSYEHDGKDIIVSYESGMAKGNNI